MKKVLFIICILSFSFLLAKEPYFIMGDIDFSPYSGAENLLSLHEALEYGFDNVFKKKKNEKYFYRSLKKLSGIILVWYPLSEFEIVVQHEIYGHGYRIRDIGSNIAIVDDYKIKTPFPYGAGGGATNYYYSSDLTSYGENSISCGGVEATAILANRLKMKWLIDSRLDPRKLFLYLQAQQDLTSYVYSMNDSVIFANEGHDIEGYLFWLNNTYYNDFLSKEDIKKAALVNLVDPMTYYCIGSFFYYIFSDRDIKIPTINIKKIKMLPNLRMGLAPYGLEYYLENFMSYDDEPIYCYLRRGKHNKKRFWGLGLQWPGLFKYKFNKIGFRVDFYRQPKIYFKKGFEIFENVQAGYSEEDLKKRIYGFYSSLIFDKKIFKEHNISLHIEGGYKTKGFMPGQALRNSIIFRLGLGFNTF